MEPLIFVTYVTNAQWMKYCAKPLEHSFKHFHPDIPFKIFKGKQVNGVFNKNDPNKNIRFLKPLLGEQLINKYKKIVFLDADQLIVGPLTELIEDNNELAGVRSNDDTGISLPCYAFETPKIPWKKYLNCGLCSISNRKAWRIWKQFNNTIRPYMRDAEQGTWNELFYSGRFSTTLLDPVESNVIYGTAANSNLWYKLYLENNKIMLNLTGIPKHVKVLHKAGVGRIGAPYDKFKKSLFSKDVANYIQKVSQ